MISRRKIMFFNDAANDDITALIYMRGLVEVIGIVVAGTGEVHGKEGAQNLADLCWMLGNGSLPIAYGSFETYQRKGHPFPDHFRESADSIFKNKAVEKNPAPNISDQPVKLVQALLDRTQPNEKVTFLVTGPLTDVARFLDAATEEQKQKIERIVIMGGAIEIQGNIEALVPDANNKVSEWNIYADPESAQRVFAANIPITLVPLDATAQVPLTPDFYKTLGESSDHRLQLVYQMLKDFYDHFGPEFFFENFYLWDPLAAMILIHPEMGTAERMRLVVDPSTAQTKKVDEGGSEIEVIMKIHPPLEGILQRLVNEISSCKVTAQASRDPSSMVSCARMTMAMHQSD